MSSLLRKVQSTINKSGVPLHQIKQTKPDTTTTTNSDQHTTRGSPTAELRRILARKASTFSLRARHRKSAKAPPSTILSGDGLREEGANGRMAEGSAPPPVPFERLYTIANEACSHALGDTTSYTHSSTESWNTAIINNILGCLIRETSKEGSPPDYKFAVNSTILQHTPSGPARERIGKRGMHSAAGAYWNNDRDGMWSFKYQAGESQGMDVVVGIMWIAVG